MECGIASMGICAFDVTAMARDEHEKPFEVTPVDDVAPADEVVRLETGGPRARIRKADRADHREKAPAPGSKPQRARPDPVERLDPGPRVERHVPETRQPTGNKHALRAPAPPVFEAAEDIWGRQAQTKRSIPWGWFVLAGLIAIGALLWSFRDARSVAKENTRERQTEEAVLEAAAQSQREAEDLVERINRTLAAFTAATSIDEMTKLVRHPDRVRPLMEAHYAGQPISPSRLEKIRLAPQNLSGRTNFWIATFRSDAGDDRVLVEVGNDGDVKIDWETHVGYQPMAWDHYATERPEGTFDFRVYAVPDDFHSDEFRDSGQWLCFRLTALRSEESLYGYARRNGPAGTRMIEALANTRGTPATLTLRLGIPPDLKSPRGVVIEQLVSPYWILLDDPDSDP